MIETSVEPCNLERVLPLFAPSGAGHLPAWRGRAEGPREQFGTCVVEMEEMFRCRVHLLLLWLLR